ncbi:unnamed protein product, partial [marine sediment metagenome]
MLRRKISIEQQIKNAKARLKINKQKAELQRIKSIDRAIRSKAP